MDVLKLLGRELRKLSNYCGAVIIHQPTRELVFDGLSVMDAEILAAVWPPAGEAGVADRITTGLEEVPGTGTEVELPANRARPGAEQMKGILYVCHVALEACQSLVGPIFWLGGHGELYRQPSYSGRSKRHNQTGAE